MDKEVWAKHNRYHTSQGATPAVIGHQILKEFWYPFLLRSIPVIFLHVYFYVNISHHKKIFSRVGSNHRLIG